MPPQQEIQVHTYKKLVWLLISAVVVIAIISLGAWFMGKVAPAEQVVEGPPVNGLSKTEYDRRMNVLQQLSQTSAPQVSEKDKMKVLNSLNKK